MGSFSSLLKGISYKRSKVRTPSQGLAVCLAPGPATWAVLHLTSSSLWSPHPPPPLEAQWPQGTRPQGWDDGGLWLES